MEKKKKQKTISLKENVFNNKLNGKSLYIINLDGFKFLDSNFSSNIFYNMTDRQKYQKWEFIKNDTINSYLIKNSQTGLFLTSNDSGELFTDTILPENNNSAQKWLIASTSDNDAFLIQNYLNSFYLDSNSLNFPFLSKLNESSFSDLKKQNLFIFLSTLIKK